MKLILKFVYVNICLIFNPIQNGLKLGDALSPLFSDFALEYVIGRSRKTRLN
jgi:hypothetical protein